MGFRRLLFFFACLFPLACQAADPSPRDLLASLNALRVDAQRVYTIASKDRIEFRKADAVFSFEDGKLAFFESFEGRITGFVFAGIGHVLVLPHDPVERQQVARFLGAPVLDQQFLSAYVRFTDDTDKDILHEFDRAALTPSPDPRFALLWQPNVSRLNPSHSLRILIERYTSSPAPFFHAGLDGVVTGPFDILLDRLRTENFAIGQSHTSGKFTRYDAWASYNLEGTSIPAEPFDALRYRIDTSIHLDNSLDASASIDFKSLTGTHQFLFVQLARALKVDSVTNEAGEPLLFFQNEGVTQQELNARGEDTLCVFLPKAPPPGSAFTLNFRYRGSVIEDAGNGVLFVGARDDWYPHYGDTSEFAYYDLTFHWPRRLRLVATGSKSDEHDENDSRVANWKTELPVPQAGFNLGEYASTSISSENRVIDVYANKQLEQALVSLFNRPIEVPDPAILGPRLGINPVPDASPLPPSPAAALHQLAKEVDASIRFYEIYSGPFPFKNLGVSQIPGTFGQGWPGLLYLSTFSFLPHETQERVGVSVAGQQFFSDLVPFHEVAHQWWGNVVGWSSYRDQWINEAIAGYLALLFADSQRNPNRTLNSVLDRYRKRLSTKAEGEDRAPADVGPLTIGTRLSSSKSGDAYTEVIYAKGPWIFHMLREMLRQPNAKEPDARFIALMRSLTVKYARSALTTEQLQKEVEAVMTPKMDLEGGRSMEWFFAEYVRGTGIPRYKAEYTAHKTEKGFQIRGKLLQSGVPRSFIAPVPLYASVGVGRSVFLGNVTATGEETPFTFTIPDPPHKITVDPHQTLLCIPE